MPLHARAWQHAVKALGLHVSTRDIYLWEGESGVVTARTVLTRGGADASRSSVTALLRDKERRFARAARRIRIDPHLRRLVTRLTRRGIPIALVTGTSWGEVRRILPHTLLEAFQVVVTGDRVRRGKPHPDPYRLAMQALKVSPHRTIVVENAPYGIRSARRARAGWVVALASSLPKRFLHEAHITVSSSKRLSQLLDRWITPC